MQDTLPHPSPAEGPLLDPKRLDILTLFGNEAYQELIADVSDDVPTQLARIRTAVEDGNLADLRSWAHSCRGMLSNFGCIGMTDRLEIFEHAPISAPAEAPAIHAELESLWGRTVEAIRHWESSVASFQ